MSPRLKSLLRMGAVAVAAVLPAVSAQAHPHVFVTATEEILFGQNGQVTGIRHAWKFDDMYSAFVTQGLGPEGAVLTREQMAPLAKTNVESLEEFGYFTVVKASGKQSDFGAPVDYWLEESTDKLVTLHFTLPLKIPANARTVLSLAVYDPTYFVSFSMAAKDPVALTSAPSGCSASVSKPKALDATDNQKLSEAFFSNMSPGMDFGIKLAERAIIACP